jgi:hypothetical protein
MCVASHPPEPSFEGLLSQITEPFQAMVRMEALQAPLPLQKIQGLLLLCMWPIPVRSQVSNPRCLLLDTLAIVMPVCYSRELLTNMTLLRSHKIRAGYIVVLL